MITGVVNYVRVLLLYNVHTIIMCTSIDMSLNYFDYPHVYTKNHDVMCKRNGYNAV